jgi:hypothetical protein
VPKSRNKYSRARQRQRSRRGRHQRSSRWFYIAIAAILVVGIVGVVLAMGPTSSSAGPPQPGQDHWHAAFGVNICGEWLSNPATFEDEANNPGVRAGIHTHGDGFIHIHPYYSSEAGKNATLGLFMKYGGWSVSENEVSVWEGPTADPTKTTWKNGDRCPNAAGDAGKGKPGEVVFEVNCKSVTGNPSDHRLADQEVVAIGFVPKGDEIGPPPNAQSAPENDSGTSTQPKAIDQKACRPSATNNPGIPDTAAPSTAPSTPATSTP